MSEDRTAGESSENYDKLFDDFEEIMAKSYHAITDEDELRDFFESIRGSAVAAIQMLDDRSHMDDEDDELNPDDYDPTENPLDPNDIIDEDY